MGQIGPDRQEFSDNINTPLDGLSSFIFPLDLRQSIRAVPQRGQFFAKLFKLVHQIFGQTIGGRIRPAGSEARPAPYRQQAAVALAMVSELYRRALPPVAGWAHQSPQTQINYPRSGFGYSMTHLFIQLAANKVYSGFFVSSRLVRP